MKKFLFLLLAFMLSAPMLYAQTNDDDKDKDKEEVVVPPPIMLPIRSGLPTEQFQPRNIIYVPVEGLYYDSVVTIDFAEDLGDATVTVTNTTTGESWSESGNSADGQVVVDIEAATGSYMVVIETTRGAYYALFDI